MRYLLAGLMMSLFVCGIAYAQGEADAENGATKSEVTGIPLYQGPQYDSLDVTAADIENVPPEFHSFQHRPVDEVGYSPLTLDDFRYPVVKRTPKEFSMERAYYPDHAVTVWHDDCDNYTVTAFFFTRDMIRDHIQRMIDEYYICEPDVVQQVIDYYAEVTPQCGEVISWVWFSVDRKGHHWAERTENAYFKRYLTNFEDKFFLEFGLPKVQDKVDTKVHDFLYQYTKRADHVCGPEFKELKNACSATEACDGCTKCTGCAPEPVKCKSCPTYDCGNDCREPWTKPGDKQLSCSDYSYHGFDINFNDHYMYYPRKVIIEDCTYDPLAQAYRWKFAWRFNECEVDWLQQMCAYGERVNFALVLSDPHWSARVKLDKTLVRDLMAAMNPNTWGNVWPAGNIPFDMTCCECGLPSCDGNCTAADPVGWGYVETEPIPEPVMTATPPPAPVEEDHDFGYFPPVDNEEEVIEVPGKG